MYMILVAFISRSSFTPKILKSSWSFFLISCCMFGTSRDFTGVRTDTSKWMIIEVNCITLQFILALRLCTLYIR